MPLRNDPDLQAWLKENGKKAEESLSALHIQIPKGSKMKNSLGIFEAMKKAQEKPDPLAGFNLSCPCCGSEDVTLHTGSTTYTDPHTGDQQVARDDYIRCEACTEETMVTLELS